MVIKGLTFLCFLCLVSGKQYCQYGQSCFPTFDDVNGLYLSLEPKLERKLLNEAGKPPMSAVPYSPFGNDQPLYALGVTYLAALYTAAFSDSFGTCFDNYFVTDFCKASTRNAPYEKWQPFFVAFPLKVIHVQATVNFAKRFNLCISVAGTGHDFLNRHSCQGGVMIRTTLLKTIQWDLKDSKGFGHSEGNVKFGAGIIFAEAQQSSQDNNRIISTGWSKTVGVVGWSIGGGHGPVAPSKGLGVDNILEVELVDANGNITIANAKQNKDLYWALRGGGGSTWGVITAITLKAYSVPSTGFQYVNAVWIGTYCQDGLTARDTLIDTYQQATLIADSNWGGFLQISPEISQDINACGAKWTFSLTSIYIGDSTDSNFVNIMSMFRDPKLPSASQGGTPVKFDHPNDLMSQIPVEYINPFSNLMAPVDGYVGGIPSVLVSRDNILNGKLFTKIKDLLNRCKTDSRCNRQEVYYLTGNINSQQDDYVSASPGMRTALLHYVGGGLNATETNSIYELGNYSYFSESAYSNMTSWTDRLWGSNHTNLLTTVKQIYDPNNVFYCYHCISTPENSNSSNTIINSTNTNGTNNTNSTNNFADYLIIQRLLVIFLAFWLSNN